MDIFRYSNKTGTNYLRQSTLNGIKKGVKF